MKISTNPPQYLSNHEVLTHFLDLKSESKALQDLIATRTARNAQEMRRQYPPKAVKGENEEDVPYHDFPVLDAEGKRREEIAVRRGVGEESVWVQDQVLKYLCSDYNPTARQTPDGVAKLATDLQRYGLVKAEVLQICNLAPIEPVELYCIIEESDTRFANASEALEQIASEVQSTLLPSPPQDLLQYTTSTTVASSQTTVGDVGMDDEERMYGQMREEYVHEAEWGEGKEAGVGEEVENDMD